MRKLLKKTLLFLSLTAFVVSILQVSDYWDYQNVLPDIAKQLRQKVTEKDISKEIQSSIDKKEFDDARMYLAIAQSNHYPIDINRYSQIIAKQDTQFSRVSKKTSQFVSGFFSGKSESAAGIAGAISADFTVVGDVRDLHKEYKKQQKGEEVNELIVALSGVGVGLTALTVGSFGSAAPAKSGVSLIKLASKTRRLSSRFQKKIVQLGKRVFDWGLFTRLLKESPSISKKLKQIPRAAKKAYHPKAIDPLKKIAKQVNSVRKSTSVTDTLYLLKYVETTDDLRHLEKISLKYGTKTKGMMKLVGKGALRTVRVLRKSAELLISLISSVFSAMLSLFLMFARRSL